MRRQGRQEEAEISLKAALARDPAMTPAWFSLAFLYQETGRRIEARESLLNLCRQSSADKDTLRQAGELLADFGCHEAAADVYARLVEHEPVAKDYQRLGQYYQKLGRFEAAAAAFTRAIESDASQGVAYMLLANTRRMQESDRPLQPLFEAALDHGLDEDDRACIHFGLGKLHDDWQEYDAAFSHFRQANALRHRKFSFEREQWRDFIRRTLAVFDAPLPRNRSAAGQGPAPGFVLGMLRSGTTLVERLLANNPKIRGIGETELLDHFIQRIATLKSLPYPECLSALDGDELQLIASDFHRQLAREHGDAAYILEKNPLNFMHVGFIALLFPEAAIIHCRRDPLDTCLSIYCQNFAHRRNNYAYDLGDIAAFYAGYERLMDFWRALLPGRLIEIQYETLVAEPEAAMRRLHAAMGLEWAPEATRPQGNPATISTASVWQARQPIYTYSAGRWRNYAKQLAPLQDALAENRVFFQR